VGGSQINSQAKQRPARRGRPAASRANAMLSMNWRWAGLGKTSGVSVMVDFLITGIVVRIVSKL
jgi:hypothetical protein